MGSLPRFAALLASLLLIAASIGINIARYPVVWDMVGGLEASAAGTGPQTPEPAGATSGRQCPPDGGQAQSAPPTLPEERAAPRPNPLREAVAVEQSTTVPDSSSPPGDFTGLRPLVPVILSGLEQGPRDPRSAPSSSDGGIRRLPPLDRVAPRPPTAIPAPDDWRLPPSYPSTGF